MTLDDITAEFRSQRQDKQSPPLWSGAEIALYLNSALDEACERALLLEDRTTPACCAITLIADQPDYPLHAKVIKVKRVTYAGQALIETSVEEMDGLYPQWEALTSSTPVRYILTQGSIRLIPAPSAASILVTPAIALTVFRTPLLPFNDSTPGNTSPEIAPLYHLRLMPWLYRCALLKTDAETLDVKEAEVQEGIFERSFGVRPDANVQRKRRDKRPPIVQMIF
jgi:hypothetical protein